VLTPKQHAHHIIRAVIFGTFIAFVILSVASLLFVLIWGSRRFQTDFWPLDNSRVGPNLVASVAATIAIVAHNEYRSVVNAVEHRDHLRQILAEMWATAAHPAQTAEEHVAEDVAHDVREDSTVTHRG
jgi:hypothetical protein